MFTACGGGGGGSSSPANVAGAFRVLSCNLGCNELRGCNLTDIAQNQPLVFNFTREVNPGTVNFSTISLKTSSGAEPVGRFLVDGNTVTFLPEVRSLQGTSFFGFQAGETYVLEIGAPGQPERLTSTAGDVMGTPLRCLLRVSLGVVDLDNKPPLVRVVAPVQTRDIPIDSTFTLEFDEFIDQTPFLGAAGDNAPIVFRVRRTRLGSSGELICNTTSQPTILAGDPVFNEDQVRGTTTLTFVPKQGLPTNSCLEIVISSQVVDLAGKPIQPQVLRYFTEIVILPEETFTEDFDDDAFLDIANSSGSWGGVQGDTARFGRAGGDGHMGDFVVSDGVTRLDSFLWRVGRVGQDNLGVTLDNIEVPTPAFRDGTNVPITVTDGVFEFTNFRLAEDDVLVFNGNVPVQILVRGNCEIDGTILLDAPDWTDSHDGNEPEGQRGSAIDLNGNRLPPPAGDWISGPMQGGPGGAPGGQGGSRPPGDVDPGSRSPNGENGFDVRVLPGHVYNGTNRVLLTGGRGSPLTPTEGDRSLLDFDQTYLVPLFIPALGRSAEAFANYTTAGGAGGGHFTAGTGGTVVVGAHRVFRILQFAGPPPGVIAFGAEDPTQAAADTAGGVLFDFLPRPANTSAIHYLVGGSGGGGGGSHAPFARFSYDGVLDNYSLAHIDNGSRDVPAFYSGGAGGGGGGAIMIQAGRSLRIGPTARISATGGDAADQVATPTLSGNTAPFPATGVTAPGGGGSGGSIVLISDGTTNISGTLDVRGGSGGSLVLDPPEVGDPPLKIGFNIDVRGGDGGDGFMRLEVPEANPQPSLLGTTFPAATSQNVAQLTEPEDGTAFQSLWYSTEQVFAPTYLRYELDVLQDDTLVTYSDDPAAGVGLAQHGQSPVHIYFQAADIDLLSGEPLNPNEIGDWREYVSDEFVPVPGTPTLGSDNRNGFRFLMVIDRTFPVDDVRIEELRLVFQPQ